MNKQIVVVLFALVVSGTAVAQENQLAIGLAVGEMDEDDPFTTEQLGDAVTVLLTAKLSSVRIVLTRPVKESDDLQAKLSLPPLTLAVTATCNSGGCAWRAELHTTAMIGPFGEIAEIAWWHRGALLTGGNRSRYFTEIKSGLDDALDEPIAEWLRLSDAERECWVNYFSDPVGRLPVGSETVTPCALGG